MRGSGIRELRHYGWHIGYCALLLCVTWLFLLYMVQNAREQSVWRIEQINDQLARGLEEHVRRSLYSLDEDMQLLRTEYERNGVSPAVQAYFEKVIQNPLLNQVLILDGRGSVVASARSNPPDVGFGDRAYFSVHQQPGSQDRLYISEPFSGRVTGSPVVALSRKLRGLDGRQGVIVMAIDSGYFSRFYHDMKLQPGQLIRVIGTDRIIRASSSREITEVGVKLDRGYLFSEMLPQAPVGRYFTPGRTFGIPRYFSYRAMPEYPLIVQVGYDVDAALAPFRERRNAYLAAAGVVSLLLVLFTGLAIRHTRQERQQQMRWQQVMEDLNDGIWEWDVPSGRFILSARCMEMLGFPTQNADWPDEQWRQRYHPADAGRLQEARRKHLTGESAVFDEAFRIRCQNGEYKWIRSRGKAVRDQAGNIIRLTGVMTDIHAEKSAEESARNAELALAESREKYRVVVEQAFDAVVMIEPGTWRIIETNRRFCEWFGYRLPDDAPLHRNQILFDDEASQVDYDALLFRQGFLPAERRVYRHKNGTALFMERSAVLIHHQGQSLVVVTYRNIAEQVKHEQMQREDAAVAQKIQQAQLSCPPDNQYVRIQTVFHSAGEISGDLYHLEWRNDGRLLRGYLLDVTGHGLTTALYTSALNVLLHEAAEMDASLSEQLSWLNQQVLRYFEPGSFAAAIAFELDLQIRQLRYTGAGITRFWTCMEGAHGMVQAPGLYLGIDAEQEYPVQVLPLAAGDRLCFVTDGMERKLLDRVSPSEQDWLQACFGFDEWTTEEMQEPGRDDATAVCIEVRSLPVALQGEQWPKSLVLNGYEDYRRLKGELARAIAEATGKPHSMPEVAVNEAVANALECRDGKARKQRAEVKFNRFGGRFVVRVRTSRIGFAGNAVLRRLRANPESLFAFGEDASMGRGIPLMLSIADKMTYNHDGTEVLLAWKVEEICVEGEQRLNRIKGEIT